MLVYQRVSSSWNPWFPIVPFKILQIWPRMSRTISPEGHSFCSQVWRYFQESWVHSGRYEPWISPMHEKTQWFTWLWRVHPAISHWYFGIFTRGTNQFHSVIYTWSKWDDPTFAQCWMLGALWLAMIGPRVGSGWAWVSHCKPWPCCGWCSRTTWWRRLSRPDCPSQDLESQNPFFCGQTALTILWGITALIVWSHLWKSCYVFFLKHILSKKYGFAIGRFVWELLGLFTAVLQQNVEQLRFCYG